MKAKTAHNKTKTTLNADNMKEEYRQEHFRVPEGYFESFTEKMMGQLPDQPFQAMTTKRKRSWLPHIAAAAVVILLASATTLYFTMQEMQKERTIKANIEKDSHEDTSTYTVEEAAHYAMIDNQGVYYMLMEQ